MSFARKMARRKKKAAPPTVTGVDSGATIHLQNPVSDHFPTFIIGQAFAWQLQALCDIEEKAPPSVYDDVVSEFQNCKPGFAFPRSVRFQAALDAFCDGGKPYVVQEGEKAGRSVVICGAGPSLVEHAAQYCTPDVDVWGCNSALLWLHDRGYPVTHGLTVDQTPQMCVEWLDAPDVEYLIGSSVHPNLSDHLVAKGRRIRRFHNYVHIERKPVTWLGEDGQEESCSYEQWMYATMFPSTVMVGSGLNAVTRAIDVARHMGYDKITVLGADCALKLKGERTNAPFGSAEHKRWLEENTVMHANGGSAIAGEQSPLTLGAVIDSGTTDGTVRPGHGRHWETKVDLAISAVWLVKFAQRGIIELVGDTFPNALLGKDDTFLRRLPNFHTAAGEVMLPEIT